MKKDMKRKTHKTIAIVIIVIIIFPFTAINIATEPVTIGTGSSVTPGNVVQPYMHNNTGFLYAVGYVNLTGFGNNVSYVYAILPFGGAGKINLNYSGPFIEYCLYKVNQKMVFPFTNTSLYIHTTFQPYRDLNSYSPNIGLQVYKYPGCFISGMERGALCCNRYTGTHKFYVNMTLTPVFDISIYHISGKSKTLHFVFNVNVTKFNITN